MEKEGGIEGICEVYNVELIILYLKFNLGIKYFLKFNFLC